MKHKSYHANFFFETRLVYLDARPQEPVSPEHQEMATTFESYEKRKDELSGEFDKMTGDLEDGIRRLFSDIRNLQDDVLEFRQDEGERIENNPSIPPEVKQQARMDLFSLEGDIADIVISLSQSILYRDDSGALFNRLILRSDLDSENYPTKAWFSKMNDLDYTGRRGIILQIMSVAGDDDLPSEANSFVSLGAEDRKVFKMYLDTLYGLNEKAGENGVLAYLDPQAFLKKVEENTSDYEWKDGKKVKLI